jgi:hypothetical protein
MTAKIRIWLLATILLTTALPVEAQQAAKIPRIGYVSGTGDVSNPGPYVEALRQGLRDLGYIQGKNIVIEYRGAEGKLGPSPKPCSRACKTQDGCPCRTNPISNSRGPGGDQDDSDCHGDW